MREPTEIERFFHNTLLRISTFGISIILIIDTVINPSDQLSILMDALVLFACILALVLRNISFDFSVLIVTGITLGAMVYQSMAVPVSTTTSLSVILIVGFANSMLLKGSLLWSKHTLTVVLLLMVFVYQYQHPEIHYTKTKNDIIAMAGTYIVLYFVISFCTTVLKLKYDKINGELIRAISELSDKSSKIEAQNVELTKIHDRISALNEDLERKVVERTESLNERNRQILEYSYMNAHYLRGPVARLLGLVALRKLEKDPDYPFFFNTIEEQVKEIDQVVKDIGKGLNAVRDSDNK